MHSDANYRSACTEGEPCTVCGTQAWRKVEETIFHDDPHPHRPPYTSYLCLEHFNAVMGIRPREVEHSRVAATSLP